MILHCLVEGNSVRGTSRLSDVEKRTVLNILKLAGERCEQLLTEQGHNVQVRDLELDEVGLCGMQAKAPHARTG